MKLKRLFIACFALLFTTQVFSQKINLTSGNLDFLKGQKVLNIEYDYDNMAVGKYDKEADYVKEKVADYNKKEAGKGDEWKKNWIADRKKRYEPKFEELFNDKGVLQAGNNAQAAYTMIVKTTFTEPGFNVGVMRKDASVNFEVIFVKTDSKEEVAKITMLKSPGRGGMGYDFDAGFRIQEAYAKAGKSLIHYLAKQLK